MCPPWIKNKYTSATVSWRALTVKWMYHIISYQETDVEEENVMITSQFFLHRRVPYVRLLEKGQKLMEQDGYPAAI